MTTIQRLMALRDSVATGSAEWQILQNAVLRLQLLEQLDRSEPL
ncbi:hypothetical protein [Rhodococcus qingshengii]|nr:hypothetical protein [Rhodococcus qingshengii]